MIEWFEKWIGLDCYNEPLRNMQTAVQNFCANWVQNRRENPLLFLAGESGTGKTHCARRVARFALAAAPSVFESGAWRSGPPSVCFVRWPEFIEAESKAWTDEVMESSLTILDDVGSESDRYRSGVGVDKLCQLLDARAKKNRFTFITSNYGVEEWAERDTRVADRLLRNSVRVPLDGVTSWALRFLA